MDEQENQKFYTMRGVCRYCGQVVYVSPCDSQEEADEAASEKCDCGGARRARTLLERKEKAMNAIDNVFGAGASAAGYEPVDAAALMFLKAAVVVMAEETVGAISVEIPGKCRAKFSFTSKGNIKICRSETRTRSLES